MVEVLAKVAGKGREALDKQAMCVGRLAPAEEVLHCTAHPHPNPATPPPSKQAANTKGNI